MTDSVQALSYASIILSEGGKEVSEENMKKLMDAAGIVVDPFVLSVCSEGQAVMIRTMMMKILLKSEAFDFFL